jgi:hypothetical protein
LLGDIKEGVTTDLKNVTEVVTEEPEEEPESNQYPNYLSNQGQINMATGFNQFDRGFGIRVGTGGSTKKMRIAKVPKITRNQKKKKRKQTKKQTRKPRRKQTKKTNKRTRKHRN